jgi:hypothetical protein
VPRYRFGFFRGKRSPLHVNKTDIRHKFLFLTNLQKCRTTIAKWYKIVNRMMMFVNKTGCSAGERYSHGLFSKVLLGAQNWGGQGGQQTGLRQEHRAKKDQDLVRSGASDLQDTAWTGQWCSNATVCCLTVLCQFCVYVASRASFFLFHNSTIVSVHKPATPLKKDDVKHSLGFYFRKE